MDKDLIPAENSRPIAKPEELLSEIENLKAEVKRLKAQSAIPIIKALKDEVISRAESGKLKEELKGKKIGSIIKDLSVIKQILEENMPQVAIITPPARASEGKDVTWHRANSATSLSDSERRKMREKVIDAEVEDETHETGRRGAVQGPGQGSAGAGEEQEPG